MPDLDVSEPLRNAIARALSQRADDRLPTAEAMSSALQDTPEAKAAADSPRRRLLDPALRPKREEALAR